MLFQYCRRIWSISEHTDSHSRNKRVCFTTYSIMSYWCNDHSRTNWKIGIGDCGSFLTHFQVRIWWQFWRLKSAPTVDIKVQTNSRWQSVIICSTAPGCTVYQFDITDYSLRSPFFSFGWELFIEIPIVFLWAITITYVTSFEWVQYPCNLSESNKAFFWIDFLQVHNKCNHDKYIAYTCSK